LKHTRIIVTHYGGPDALQVVEEDIPEPQDGEVRVKVRAAGVSLPDIMAREGFIPRRLWCPSHQDGIWLVWSIGSATASRESNQATSLPPCSISGSYAEFVCLPQRELVPVPAGLDAAEAVSLVLNYITAYQMLHRSAKVKSAQRALIHGAAGGVGSALLQLGRLAGLEMYGTSSSRGASAVSALGGIPIDYRD
jgi:NADPH:quinone reductase